jgi:hypothetical protein
VVTAVLHGKDRRREENERWVLGYMELDRRGAEMLFQVLTEREEELDRDRVQRILLRLDQDLHRPAPLRRDRRPTHFNGTSSKPEPKSYRLAHTKAQQATAYTNGCAASGAGLVGLGAREVTFAWTRVAAM